MLCWIDHVWSSKECVCCACDPNKQCIRPHPIRKQTAVRAIRRIKDDAIVKDLDKFSIDQRCVDVDTMVEMYERFVYELLDKHAPHFKKESGTNGTRVINCEGNHHTFSFWSKKITLLSEYTSSCTLASSINMFLFRKLCFVRFCKYYLWCSSRLRFRTFKLCIYCL